MYVSAQGVDERMINVHYYYYFGSETEVATSLSRRRAAARPPPPARWPESLVHVTSHDQTE